MKTTIIAFSSSYGIFFAVKHLLYFVCYLQDVALLIWSLNYNKHTYVLLNMVTEYPTLLCKHSAVSYQLSAMSY